MKNPKSDIELHKLLHDLADRYNRPEFIKDDPIGLPHRFSGLQDREIIGFWTAMLAWGQRKTIIKSGEKLLGLMDHAPFDFIKNHEEKDRSRFDSFVHRTFQPMDALYFLDFLQRFYKENNSLEDAFVRFLQKTDEHIGPALEGFHNLFFEVDYAPGRTRKHVATPLRKSTCKRLNMFLRWMVRTDDKGVDFGIWKNISPSQLLIPLDVHVERVARRLGLLTRKQTDWMAVVELTENLKKIDPSDPVRFDFALFGLGVLEKQNSKPF